MRYISECKLKDICFPITYGLAASAIPFDGIHKYIRITDIDENTGEYLADSLVSPAYFSNEYKVVNNDILFARTGASVGKTYIHTDIDNTYFAGFLMRIRLFDHNPYYIYQQFKTKYFKKWLAIMSMRSGQPGINSTELGNYTIKISSKKSEDKIAEIFKAIDNRINTQKKIIEDLIILKNNIINIIYETKTYNCKLDNCIAQVSNRNKNDRINDVLSVSNKLGFIKQSEQFEEREIASDDVTNYKIIEKNMFAYNPARINVGSIAKHNLNTPGIVSPMYICFKTNNNIDANYLNYYFSSNEFKKQMRKRLEGSVRLCLTYESMINIPFYLPSVDIQKKNAALLTAFTNKIDFEKKYLSLLESQKAYLLNKMFI